MPFQQASRSSSVSSWALGQDAFAVEPFFEQQRKQLSMLFRVANQERGYFLRADVGILGEKLLHQLLQSRFPLVVYGASPMAAAVCETRCSMAISRPPPRGIEAKAIEGACLDIGQRLAIEGIWSVDVEVADTAAQGALIQGRTRNCACADGETPGMRPRRSSEVFPSSPTG